MSVAFRRESDDEHKEPRFELPLPPGPNIVTARGLRLIRDKLAALDAALAAAPAPTDAEPLHRERRYWITRLTTAEVAPRPADTIVAIGSRVRFLLNGTPRQVDIVGADEADPATNRVGFAAPLAQALIGAEPGEDLDFNGRSDAIHIESTAAIPEEDDC